MSLQIEISELRRELAMRNKLYPGFIAKKKITAGQAEAAKRDLQAAIETMEGLLFIQSWFLKHHPDLLKEFSLGGAIICVLENYRLNQGKLQYLRDVKKD